jgi:hypothetical protein
LLVEAFVSFDSKVTISINDFDEFQSGYASGDKQFMVGKVRLSKLAAWSQQDGVGIILAPNSTFTPVAALVKEDALELKSA